MSGFLATMIIGLCAIGLFAFAFLLIKLTIFLIAAITLGIAESFGYNMPRLRRYVFLD